MSSEYRNTWLSLVSWLTWTRTHTSYSREYDQSDGRLQKSRKKTKSQTNSLSSWIEWFEINLQSGTLSKRTRIFVAQTGRIEVLFLCPVWHGNPLVVQRLLGKSKWWRPMCPASIYQTVVFRCENVVLCQVQTSESLEDIFPLVLSTVVKKKSKKIRFTLETL